MPNFDKYESLTYMVIKFHHDTTGRGTERKMYSFLRMDKKGKDHGIASLAKYAKNNVSKIEFAAIFDNQTGSHIETIIENGKTI